MTRPPSGFDSRPGDAAVEIEAVDFTYPDGTEALDGVHLRIARGERVAIVGQNGSGKSTLVRHLNGLLRPGSGRVRLFGRDTSGVHVAELARTVGLAFQNPDRQVFARSVWAEVAFGPRNLGRRGAALDRDVQAALLSVGLEHDAQVNPYEFGYSRRKLLALASVVAMDTPIIVLDEPTTGQDGVGIARIRALVEQLSDAGRTLVAISHDMRFVAENFDRVVLMGSGQVLLDGSPTTVFAEPAWPLLESSSLAPPYPAILGARLGLGSTPTDATFVDALAARVAVPNDSGKID